MVTISDLLKVPESLHRKLERESELNADNLVDAIFSRSERRREEERIREEKVQDIVGLDKGSNWGGGGW